MKKSGYAVIAVSVVFMGLMYGCAMLGGGISPEESISQALAVIKEGTLAKDIAKVMTVYSEDYMGADGENKAATTDTLQGYVDQGYMDDIEVNIEDAVITVEGETATATPVGYTTNMGLMSFGYDFKKDPDGQWRVSSVNQAY
jgi:ketosteroid isomerase-like protein